MVISRKGILKYRIDITGVGGHSGIHYFECKNAVAEAAHKVVALSEKSALGGITYSCNIMQGGILPNIVPDHCSVTIDVRVPRHAQQAESEKTVRQIAETGFIGGTSATVTCIGRCPPMEKNPATRALFENLLAVCRKYGLGSLAPVESAAALILATPRQSAFLPFAEWAAAANSVTQIKNTY
ncbi:MAG: peptidase dimerization domain-containing protein [Clostridia bacterium]|nr:peptidase dimerization domain-containing protein [Clostridia bacterium]